MFMSMASMPRQRVSRNPVDGVLKVFEEFVLKLHGGCCGVSANVVNVHRGYRRGGR